MIRCDAVGRDAHDAAARVGRPQRAVALRQNAFRALQIVADVAEENSVDSEVEYGVSQASPIISTGVSL